MTTSHCISSFVLCWLGLFIISLHVRNESSVLIHAVCKGDLSKTDGCSWCKPKHSGSLHDIGVAGMCHSTSEVIFFAC